MNGYGNYDILVAKYDSDGDLQWQQQYNGAANSDDAGTGLYVDGSYNVYVTGTVATSSTNRDIITIKYNSSGTQQWLETYDSNSFDSGGGIIVESNGNVYVTGLTYDNGYDSDVITIKNNSSGDEQWATTWDHNNLNDGGVKLAFSDTMVIVSIVAQHTTTTYKYEVLRLGKVSGNLVNGTVSGTSSTGINEAFDMVIDDSGNIYIAGATPVTGQGYDYCVIKLNSNLGISWERTYNGNDDLDDMARGIKVDGSGNVYVTGYSTTSSQGKDIVTIKYNSNGTQQWVETYNDEYDGDDEAFAMAIDNYSNIYITGYTMTDVDQLDSYTAKYDTDGDMIWSINMDGEAHLNDKTTNITIDTDSNIVITGSSEES
ncbi:MAG: hypothetical protein Kow0068_17220 [Marinilabiliales bacterium]